jgi:hypothetical protein
MTQLQSTKAINSLKLKAIKKGGYQTMKSQIIKACENHFKMFGVDLKPSHI